MALCRTNNQGQALQADLKNKLASGLPMAGQ